MSINYTGTARAFDFYFLKIMFECTQFAVAKTNLHMHIYPCR